MNTTFNTTTFTIDNTQITIRFENNNTPDYETVLSILTEAIRRDGFEGLSGISFNRSGRTTQPTLKPQKPKSKIAKTHFKNAECIECAVCLQEKKNRVYTKLCCGHTFHKNCIKTWLTKSDNCPLCRKLVN